MQILPTNEFLAKKLRLVNGNPFSETQAEEEDQLSKYFVDLSAFYKILDIDTGKRKSSILSASRGCGKSANRRNVERWLQHGPKQEHKIRWPWDSPVLVATYTDFSRLKTLVNGDFSKTRPEDHVKAILWVCVSCLLHYLDENWETYKSKNTSDWVISQLGYFLTNYTAKWADFNPPKDENLHLTSTINLTLNSFLDRACIFAYKANTLALGGTTGLLKAFKEVASAFGIKNIVVLVDGVDELELTGNDPQMGALLLKPLISERILMQLNGFYFKFFLPNEVVSELKKMPETRIGERIKFYEIIWDEASIQLLLSERLKAFSNGSLYDLGQFAAPDVTNVGQTLARVAQNNPRSLLKLSNFLLVHLEQSVLGAQSGDGPKDKSRLTKSQEPRITKLIVDAAVKSFENDRDDASAYITPEGSTTNVNIPLLSAHGWEITSNLIVVYKGKIVSSEKLDRKEYEVLSYLIRNIGQLVKREEIGKAVWKEKWMNKYDWVLNQAVLRLRKKIGANRIETVRGIGYVFRPD
jgi:hypothetical protein